MLKLKVTETGLKFSNVDISERFNVLDLIFQNIHELDTVKTYTDDLVEVRLENNQLFSILNGNKHVLLANLRLEDSERIFNAKPSNSTVQLVAMAQMLQSLEERESNSDDLTVYLRAEKDYLTRTLRTGDVIYLFLGYKVDGKFTNAIRLDSKDFYRNLMKTHKSQL